MSELTYSKKLSGLLASFSVIVLLGANLFQTMTIDTSTIMFVLSKVLPAALIMGYIGYLTGNILDNPKSKKRKK